MMALVALPAVRRGAAPPPKPNPALLKAPGFALKALFGEGAEPLLGGQWGVPRVLQQAGFTFRHADVRSALAAALGIAR